MHGALPNSVAGRGHCQETIVTITGDDYADMIKDGATSPSCKSYSNLGETRQYFTVTDTEIHPSRKDTPRLTSVPIAAGMTQNHRELRLGRGKGGGWGTMDFLWFSTKILLEKRRGGGGGRDVFLSKVFFFPTERPSQGGGGPAVALREECSAPSCMRSSSREWS